MAKIRSIEPADWPDIERIYLDGISTGLATFETSSPGWVSWNESHLTHSRWVALENDQIAGWVALSPVSDRCVYGGVAEISIYVSESHRGKGIGKKLLARVIESSEENGIWTLNAATFAENQQSIGLHLNSGFRKVGIRERIGKLNGVWKDNVIMERRSPKF